MSGRIAFYEQALAIAREVKARAVEGSTLNNLGLAYGGLGQYEQAIALHEQALTIAPGGAASGGRR